MKTTLDITDWKETGEELKRMITVAVKDTQRLILKPLPDIMLITKAQFDYFVTDPDIIQMYETTDLLYSTPYNVMEIRVKQ